MRNVCFDILNKIMTEGKTQNNKKEKFLGTFWVVFDELLSIASIQSVGPTLDHLPNVKYQISNVKLFFRFMSAVNQVIR